MITKESITDRGFAEYQTVNRLCIFTEEACSRAGGECTYFDNDALLGQLLQDFLRLALILGNVVHVEVALVLLIN